MVTNACSVYNHSVEWNYHLLAFKHRANQRWTKQIAREECQALIFTIILAFILEVVQSIHESCSTTLATFYLIWCLDIVAVIEM